MRKELTAEDRRRGGRHSWLTRTPEEQAAILAVLAAGRERRLKKNGSEKARAAQRRRRLGPDGRPLVHSAAQAARMAEMGILKKDPGTWMPAVTAQPVFPVPTTAPGGPVAPQVSAVLPEPGPMVKALLGVSLEMGRFWPWDEWLGTREEWLEYDRLWKAAKKKP